MNSFEALIMEDNLLNCTFETSENCFSPVKNRVVAKFSELPISFDFVEIQGRERATANTKDLVSKKPCLTKCEVLLMMLKGVPSLFTRMLVIY